MERRSILDSTGTELIGVMSPVSICMLLVVLLLSALSPPSSSASSSPPPVTAATLLYLESPSDSPSQKLAGALLDAAVFVVLIAAVTFLLVLLYYYRCTGFLRNYMRFSAFFVLASMGGTLVFSLLRRFSLPLDAPSSLLLLLNFSALGVLSIFSPAVPILLRQSYMVLLAVIVATWFVRLPEWTTWVLLLALAAYDLVAVLAPRGPLRMLVELAQSRDDDLPALVYEARPTVAPSPTAVSSSSSAVLSLGSVELQPLDPPSHRSPARPSSSQSEEIQHVDIAPHPDLAMERKDLDGESSHFVPGEPSSSSRNSERRNVGVARNPNSDRAVVEMEILEETSPLISATFGGRGGDSAAETSNSSHAVIEIENLGEERSHLVPRSSPNDSHGGRRQQSSHPSPSSEDEMFEATRGVRLGLGDFVFYSVLVGRAAMYDLMTVYACYLAIISGLGCTLILLSVCRRALPALPISITLGVVFYFLTRLLMEPFVVGASANLVMF